MSAFSRTSSGLANYHHFHGVAFTAYVEGKVNDVAGTYASRPHDETYYECLLSIASGGKKVKVKCVGNKQAALDYAKRIREGGVAHSVVIVDKDLDGVLSSPLSLHPVVPTFGYSWENELWTRTVIEAILVDLTNMPQAVTPLLDTGFRRLSRRIKYLSLLDMACQVNGESLLSKRSALCGVSFSYPVISVKEIRRLRASFNSKGASSCYVARSLIRGGNACDVREIVQGHFWSNMMMRVIGAVLKKITGDSAPSNSSLINLALSVMRRDPERALGADLVARYRFELARVGILQKSP